jgi:hypothetical protein
LLQDSSIFEFTEVVMDSALEEVGRTRADSLGISVRKKRGRTSIGEVSCHQSGDEVHAYGSGRGGEDWAALGEQFSG